MNEFNLAFIDYNLINEGESYHYYLICVCFKYQSSRDVICCMEIWDNLCKKYKLCLIWLNMVITNVMKAIPPALVKIIKSEAFFHLIYEV